MKKILVSLFIVSVILGCGGGPTEKSQKKAIAVSIYPIYDIVRNIAGDKAEVFFVIPPRANPHTYEPKPSDIKKIKGADYTICVSREFDGWIEKFVQPVSERMYLMEETAVMQGRDKNSHDINPHIWLSFKGARVITEKVYKFLCEKDRANAEYYGKNFAGYSKTLDEAERRASLKLKNLKNRRFIQWHPSWNYFAADFALEISGTIESGHGDEPSVKRMKGLVETARAKSVKVIIVDINTQASAAGALANEIGGRVVQLDGIGAENVPDYSTYIGMMLSNAEILARELNR